MTPSTLLASMPRGASRPGVGLAFVALLASTFALGSWPGSAAAQENLLKNPSAEDGTLLVPAAWDTTESGLPTVRFSWDKGIAHDGDRSLSIVSTSDVMPIWFNWSQSLPGVNRLGGKDLILRAWVQTRQMVGKAYILLQAYRDTVLVESLKDGIPRLEKRGQMGIKPVDDPQLEMGWARKQLSGDHPEWTLLETRLFIPPSTNVVIARAGILGIGEVRFDDFSLTAAPAQPDPPIPLGKNLLADPGFEGNLDQWDYSLAPVQGLRIRPDAVAHSGLQSCLIDCQGRSPFQMWSGVCQVFNTRALSGKRVRLSGWYKSQDLNSTYACLSVYATGMYGNFFPVVTGAWSGTHDWTFTSCEADIPLDSYTVWARAVINTGVGKVWFDDLKFEVLGDTPGLSAPGTKPAASARKRTGKAR